MKRLGPVLKAGCREFDMNAKEKDTIVAAIAFIARNGREAVEFIVTAINEQRIDADDLSEAYEQISDALGIIDQ
jgi:hypothetical protein